MVRKPPQEPMHRWFWSNHDSHTKHRQLQDSNKQNSEYSQNTHYSINTRLPITLCTFWILLTQQPQVGGKLHRLALGRDSASTIDVIGCGKINMTTLVQKMAKRAVVETSLHCSDLTQLGSTTHLKLRNRKKKMINLRHLSVVRFQTMCLNMLLPMLPFRKVRKRQSETLNIVTLLTITIP